MLRGVRKDAEKCSFRFLSVRGNRNELKNLRIPEVLGKSPLRPNGS